MRFILKGDAQTPAGHAVGFAVSAPSGLLSLSALPSLSLITYLNGVQQESVSASSLVDLSVLSGTSNLVGLQFQSSKAFDSVRLVNNATVGLLASLQVYFAYSQ